MGESKVFTVYVPYWIVTPRGDGVQNQKILYLGNEIVSVKANKVDGVELPMAITPQMLAQIRAHISVVEKVDEDMVHITGFEYLDSGSIAEVE